MTTANVTTLIFADGTSMTTAPTGSSPSQINISMINHEDEEKSLDPLECDFFAPTTTAAPCLHFTEAGIGTGGVKSVGTGDLWHPGVYGFSKGTAANSGFYTMTGATAFRLNGSERFVAIASFTAPIGGNTSSHNLGFQDVLTGARPADGVFFNVLNNTPRAITRVNNVETNQTIPITLEYGKFYKFEIKLNQNTAVATFNLFNSTNGNIVLLNSTTIPAANVPTASGRETGAGVSSISILAGSASNIANYDYVHISINRTLSR
jgi:hypothetical protein